jgi:phosphoenolpyruvate carboxykinase (ATP)
MTSVLSNFNKIEDIEHTYSSDPEEEVKTFKDLSAYGIKKPEFIHRNADPQELYEFSSKYDKRQTFVSKTGALLCFSGEKTGRSPNDKRVVDEPSTTQDIGKFPKHF